MWGKRPDMVVHEESPFNAEPPRKALAESPITALAAFYARNHGPIPDIDADAWRLTVHGLAGEPISYSLAELRSGFTAHTVIATLQCAGNRRAGYNLVRPIPGEDPWGPAATSTARWRGVRLADVLDPVAQPGRQPGRRDRVHVAFTGADVSALADPPQRFGGSIPLAKALSPEVLLAWAMNDEPLARVHGAPVRLVVPGYIGARSIKWVTTVQLQRFPSDNYFQATAYRIVPPDAEPGPGKGISLSSVALNCDILTPDDGEHVAAGALRVAGYAFAGDGRGIARVDVSTDGGSSWQQAELAPQVSRWAWRLWHLTIDATPGPLHLTARAWDSIGATQPESPAPLWNPKGYANNSWAHIDVTVR
ncbi:MAG: sulfite oxidase [Candidatus Sericytochromatia bacterium]